MQKNQLIRTILRLLRYSLDWISCINQLDCSGRAGNFKNHGFIHRGMGKQGGATIQATRTTLEIADALRRLGQAGVSKIADHQNLPVSTVHDHLRTLEEYNYVIKEGNSYRIGTRFLELGGYARSQMPIYQTAAPEIRELAQETGEHANLMIEEQGKGVFLYKVKGRDAVQLDTYAGMRVYLHTTAAGKAMLAYMSEERVQRILDISGLPKVNENTVTDRGKFLEELREIRDVGYAIDNGERVKGVCCVGAPIVGKNGNVLGGVSVSGPWSRIQNDRLHDELPDKVLRTANIIEVNLKYRN